MNLMGYAATSLPMVDKEIVKRGIVLSHHQQVHLCAGFSEQEMK